jgi:hypothetical protein
MPRCEYLRVHCQDFFTCLVCFGRAKNCVDDVFDAIATYKLDRGLCFRVISINAYFCD